jgi:Spy/CpxP family protein refolding chaperone
MKKRNIFVVTVVAVLALAAVPFLHAQPRMHRGHGEFGGAALGHLAHAKQELGLSDQQVEEIKAILKTMHDQNATYRDQLHGGIEAIVTGLIQNPSNVAAAQAQLDQQEQAERAMKTNVLNAASKALNVLNAEQRTKLAAMVAKHKASRVR